MDVNCILPDGVITLVCLACLQLRYDIKLLLFLQILVQGQGVVFFLDLTWRATFDLLATRISRFSDGLSGSAPCVVGSTTTPVVSASAGSLILSSLSIFRCSGLDYEFAIAFVTTPALMNLLLRVTDQSLVRNTIITGCKEHIVRLASGAVSVEGPASTTTAFAATTPASSTATTAFTVSLCTNGEEEEEGSDGDAQGHQA